MNITVNDIKLFLIAVALIFVSCSRDRNIYVSQIVPYGITPMLSVFLLPAFVIFFKETEQQPELL